MTSKTREPEREHFHTRMVTCTGYCRSDGMWDIEGRVVDTRTYPSCVVGDRWIPSGEPIHDLQVTITVDDEYVIRAATVVTRASPYRCCGDIAPSYAKLAGLRLASGFSAAVRERLGGPAGCTHVTELLSPMATTAFQTISNGRSRRDHGTGAPDLKDVAEIVDSCHAFRADGEVTRKVRVALEAEAREAAPDRKPK